MHSEPSTLERCKPLLGTFVEVSLSFINEADKHDQRINQVSLAQWSNTVFNEIERIHELLGFHEITSELSQLNREMLKGPLLDYALSSDLNYVLEVAQNLYTCSSGMFDVTVAPYLIETNLLPDHLSIKGLDKNQFGDFSNILLSDHKISTTKAVCIDLGGIAKGYAVDCAFAKLPPDIECTINAGGDMRSNIWQKYRVSIKYANRTTAMKTVAMKNQSVATSASYYHDQHSAIIQPKSKLDTWIKGSVSVFASQAIIADALTKVMVLCPPKQVKSILKKYDAEGIIVSRWGFIKVM